MFVCCLQRSLEERFWKLWFLVLPLQVAECFFKSLFYPLVKLTYLAGISWFSIGNASSIQVHFPASHVSLPRVQVKATDEPNQQSCLSEEKWFTYPFTLSLSRYDRSHYPTWKANGATLISLGLGMDPYCSPPNLEVDSRRSPCRSLDHLFV